MAGEPIVTVVGNITAPAELRFTSSGVAVCNLNVAVNSRNFDKQRNEWVEGEPLWVRLNVWKEMAENCAETFSEKGSRVIAQGRLKQRSFETKEGEKRVSLEMDVDEIGPALRFATARVQKTSSQQVGGGWSQPQQQPPASDPWGRGSMNDTQPPPF